MTIRLDRVDVELYRAEIQRPKNGEAELARRLGVAPEEVCLRRQRLTELRLLEQVDDETWVARSPHAAADALLGEEERQLERRRLGVAQRREALTALTADYLDARRLRSDAGQVEVLQGVETVRATLSELAALAATSVDSMAPGGAQSEHAIRAALPLDKELLGRGVALRSLFLDSARSHSATIRYLKDIHDAGAHVRTTSLLPTRILIYDRETAIVPLDAQNTARGAVVVRDLPLLNLLNHLFHLYWDQATPLDAARTRPVELSDLERTVLRLMAAGQLDEVISRHIGLSVRTTRRIISDLTRRLGAHSRFQAGVRAAERGWIA
ncbi:helix-turn-helix transcriptional regulator [Streptomyces fradiae]|uniref:helix-turn-helix transcriptional regulator n=1 Tax=Streptomyces fradiae TaxID=1906 RepID=UPI003826FB29